uniref:Uncharacterized protein n=1 Tax=Setaria italica TaxID=4555 RepID=K3YP48_SETIT
MDIPYRPLKLTKQSGCLFMVSFLSVNHNNCSTVYKIIKYA